MTGKKKPSGSQNRNQALLKHKKQLNVIKKMQKNSRHVW